MIVNERAWPRYFLTYSNFLSSGLTNNEIQTLHEDSLKGVTVNGQMLVPTLPKKKRIRDLHDCRIENVNEYDFQVSNQ